MESTFYTKMENVDGDPYIPLIISQIWRRKMKKLV
jgi:hypothetical protein